MKGKDEVGKTQENSPARCLRKRIVQGKKNVEMYQKRISDVRRLLEEEQEIILDCRTAIRSENKKWKS
jgi:hypothetical protein